MSSYADFIHPYPLPGPSLDSPALRDSSNLPLGVLPMPTPAHTPAPTFAPVLSVGGCEPYNIDELFEKHDPSTSPNIFTIYQRFKYIKEATSVKMGDTWVTINRPTFKTSIVSTQQEISAFWGFFYSLFHQAMELVAEEAVYGRPFVAQSMAVNLLHKLTRKPPPSTSTAAPQSDFRDEYTIHASSALMAEFVYSGDVRPPQGFPPLPAWDYNTASMGANRTVRYICLQIFLFLVAFHKAFVVHIENVTITAILTRETAGLRPPPFLDNDDTATPRERARFADDVLELIRPNNRDGGKDEKKRAATTKGQLLLMASETTFAVAKAIALDIGLQPIAFLLWKKRGNLIIPAQIFALAATFMERELDAISYLPYTDGKRLKEPHMVGVFSDYDLALWSTYARFTGIQGGPVSAMFSKLMVKFETACDLATAASARRHSPRPQPQISDLL